MTSPTGLHSGTMVAKPLSDYKLARKLVDYANSSIMAGSTDML